MTTIRDVARKANVSVTTVSRVLNSSDHPVNEETRQRILDAIHELEFSPNAAARQLLKHETRTIGLIVPDIANPYYPEIVKGVETVASELGYTVILCNTHRQLDKTLHYLSVLREKRVDGIIFAGGGSEGATGQIQSLKGKNIRMVFIGRHDTAGPSVKINNVLGARQATTHLVNLGHRRIAHVAGPSVSTTSADRLAGYRQALEEAGIAVDPNLILPGDFRPQSAYGAVAGLFRSGTPRPTAIFAANDLMAVGALKAIKDAGLRVPEDIALVGFDNIDIASFVRPPLTTVAIPMYEMGVRAMSLMRDRLAGKDTEGEVWLQTELVRRESCGSQLKEPQRCQGGSNS